MTDTEFKAYQEQIAQNAQLRRSLAQLALAIGLLAGSFDRLKYAGVEEMEEIEEPMRLARKIILQEFYPPTNQDSAPSQSKPESKLSAVSPE